MKKKSSNGRKVNELESTDWQIVEVGGFFKAMSSSFILLTSHFPPKLYNFTLKWLNFNFQYHIYLQDVWLFTISLIKFNIKSQNLKLFLLFMIAKSLIFSLVNWICYKYINIFFNLWTYQIQRDKFLTYNDECYL